MKFFKKQNKTKQDLNLETTRAAFPKMLPQATLSPHYEEGGLVKTQIPGSDYFSPILGSYLALLWPFSSNYLAAFLQPSYSS